MVQRYIVFGQEHGHFVARQADGKRLHKWILNQRQAYKTGLISEERKEILEDLDFVFACNKCRKNKEFTMKQDTHWTEMFKALEEFCKREGHCRVPYVYEENRELGRWVSKQRNWYAHGLLDQEKKSWKGWILTGHWKEIRGQLTNKAPEWYLNDTTRALKQSTAER